MSKSLVSVRKSSERLGERMEERKDVLLRAARILMRAAEREPEETREAKESGRESVGGASTGMVGETEGGVCG